MSRRRNRQPVKQPLCKRHPNWTSALTRLRLRLAAHAGWLVLGARPRAAPCGAASLGLRSALAAVSLAGVLGATSANTTPRAAHVLVDATLDSLGVGRDVRTLAVLRTDMRSVMFDVVQNDHPGPPFPVQGFLSGKVIDDFADRFQVSVLDDDSSANRRLVLTPQTQFAATPDGQVVGRAVPPPPSWETEDPLRALRLASAAPDLSTEPDELLHGAQQHVVAFHNGSVPVRIFIDAQTGLPSATEAKVTLSNGATGTVAWNAWGDVLERSEFMLYDLVDGLRYPQQISVYRNGAHVRTTVRSHPVIDAPQDLAAAKAIPLAEPQALDLERIRLGQSLGWPPTADLSPQEIAPGVVQFPGSWYTTLVRQSDGVVVLDAPIAPGYSRAVLSEISRRFPGARVKAVVASTAFYWHIAGLREYAALGVPIYVRDRNLPIVHDLLAAPHHLRPDTLARRHMRPDLRPVSAPMQIGKGRNAITLIPVRYGEQPMVMSWLADAKILHTAEMVQPLGPGGALLYPEALHEITRSVAEAAVPTAGLRIIGMHMSPTPWSSVAAALEPAVHHPQPSRPPA